MALPVHGVVGFLCEPIDPSYQITKDRQASLNHHACLNTAKGRNSSAFYADPIA